MTVDKARDRVESGDSRRERNAVFRPQGPDACLPACALRAGKRAPHRQAARMDFFNGLLTPIRKNRNSGMWRKPLKRGVTVVQKDVFSVHVRWTWRFLAIRSPIAFITLYLFGFTFPKRKNPRLRTLPGTADQVSRSQSYFAVISCSIPPLTLNLPITAISRGAHTITRSSRIRFVTSSKKAPVSRNDLK